MDRDLLAIALIRRAVGLDGIVTAEVFGGTLEQIAIPATVFVGRSEQQARDMVIDAVDLRPRGYVVKFNGIDDRTAAQSIQGCTVWVDRSKIPALSDGTFYQFELIGMRVCTESGERVGSVKEIHEYPTMNALEIVREGLESIQLPMTGHLVLRVDRNEKKVIISDSFIDELL